MSTSAASYDMPVRRGFSLVELLSAVAIIAILAGFIFPAIGAVIRSGDRAKCLSNLRAVGGGFALFLVENNNYYPGEGAGANAANTSGAGSMRWTHRVGLYMDIPGPLITVRTGDQKEIAVRVRGDAYEAEVFHCPSTPRSAMVENNGSNYSLGLYGANPNIVLADANSYNILGVSANEITTPANTVLIGDRYAGGGARAAIDEPSSRGPGLHTTGPYPTLLNGLAANHESHGNPALGRGTTHILFCDGHVGQVDLDTMKPWPGKLVRFSK